MGDQRIMVGKRVTLCGQSLEGWADIDHVIALDQAQTPAVESAQFHG
jgi:hypothetical protein